MGLGKGSQSTTTTGPDQKGQQWLDLWKTTITGLQDKLGPLLGTPDYGAVRSNLVDDFGRMRTQAGLEANDYATKAGAYGGDRSAIFNAQRQSDIDRQEGSTLAQYDLGTQQDQWTRALQALGMMGGPAQFAGQRTTQQMPGNFWGDLVGLGVTGAGVASGLGWKPFGSA